MGDLEVSESSGAFGVNNPFRDPLSVEVSHLVQEDVVLKTFLNSVTEDDRVGEVVCLRMQQRFQIEPYSIPFTQEPIAPCLFTKEHFN